MTAHRAWRQDQEMLTVEAPRDLLVDPSDCLHGCNGDCLVSGSDVCNFMCHAGFAPEALAFAERVFPPMGWGE